MNSKFYILLIALCTTLSLTSFIENSCSSVGQKWVKELVKDYSEGKFKARLAVIDAEVQKMTEEGEFDQHKVYDIASLEEMDSAEGKQELEELSARLGPYQNKIAQLKRESKGALTKVAHDYPKSEISESIKAYNKIENNIEFVVEKYKSLQQLENILDCGKNPLYPQFAEIANKYKLRQYAIMSLNRDFEMIEDSAVGFHTPESANQYAIDSTLIRFEEFLEAGEITQRHSDDSLRLLITRGINDYMELHGNEYDIRYLFSLGNGSAAPRDEVEKQVADIMSNYQAKEKALIQEFFKS